MENIKQEEPFKPNKAFFIVLRIIFFLSFIPIPLFIYFNITWPDKISNILFWPTVESGILFGILALILGSIGKKKAITKNNSFYSKWTFIMGICDFIPLAYIIFVILWAFSCFDCCVGNSCPFFIR